MIEDITAFSDLLLRERRNTTTRQRAKLLSVSRSTVDNWEGVGDIISIPKEVRLEDISHVYNIDIEELRKTWNISKSAMDCVNNARKIVMKRTPGGTGLSGSIADVRSLGRTNSQVGFPSRY